ncbi:4-amino-4-deoxychorismate lyase [Natronospira proteinivora]|uniref:Aminodeoxychorismate lyase n=1 Tax=Natronospira proteinivora TaxID=1807133 RepID=A0ABT1G7D6_9GAMM|nr:aminodeoxychorismate lyase [Natronospira proteinivora]MCP1726865.1 4-amino-4-deoxychorismate lyase [Natronospira proteinivora]
MAQKIQGQWQLNEVPLESEAWPNRGLQFGESLFETMLAMDGRLPLWERHWARLRQGCERLEIPCPPKATLREDIRRMCPPQGRWVIKLILTLAGGDRGYRRPSEPESQCYLGCFPAPDTSGQLLQLQLCEHRLGRQAALAGLKHSNRLDQVLARREVDQAGRDEGLLRDEDGRIIEAVAANIFLVGQGMVLTPELSHSGVAGVMRAEVLDSCRKQGIDARVTELRLRDILLADEVFLSNSLNGIRPVVGLHGHDIQAQWPPGRITHQLQTVLKEKGVTQ